MVELQVCLNYLSEYYFCVSNNLKLSKVVDAKMHMTKLFDILGAHDDMLYKFCQ